ncbi:hypothetical protein A3L09_06455 [Thermococcus profundus]|uniref:Uncharacterized protein n=2 Tax=Thermococcus profundus TaxID=49899 RepID=A0A2Z2MKH2_THEPR|nr:hypothetical protein A3L09_06455 [Thermococcus profundus]
MVQVIMGFIFIAVFTWSVLTTAIGWSENKVRSAANKAIIKTGIDLFPLVILKSQKRVSTTTLITTPIIAYSTTFFSAFFGVPYPITEFFSAFAETIF